MLFQPVLVHIGITLVSLPACEDEFGSFPGVAFGSTLGPLWDNFWGPLGSLSGYLSFTFGSLWDRSEINLGHFGHRRHTLGNSAVALATPLVSLWSYEGSLSKNSHFSNIF